MMTEKKSELNFIGRNVRYLRRQKGWSISQLAKETGVAEVPLGRIERGENAPSAAVLYGLSKALNVAVDVFSRKHKLILYCVRCLMRDPLF